MFCLEEVIGVIKVNRLLPSLSCLLVALKIGVMGNEDSCLIVSLGSFMGQRRRELSGSPCEVKHMRFDELPRSTQIFGYVELLVDFTGLAIVEVVTGCPSGGQSPSPLLGMVGELVNLLARIESSEV
jgi:hypothetical protein